jgi:hypothetical protein
MFFGSSHDTLPELAHQKESSIISKKEAYTEVERVVRGSIKY